MGKLGVFVFLSLDGYIEGPNRDISWHPHDPEGAEFAQEGLKSGSTLLFGRVTYDLMTRYWPTPQAAKDLPAVAEGMNRAEKIVFSRTLKRADWNNTRLVKDNMVQEVRTLKQTPGRNLRILGSGSIITQLAAEGLIDEYQIMVDPVALGSGTPIFKGLRERLNLKLMGTRPFRNGSVLLTYQPREKR
jgi:dihydrofolate reductase